MMLLVMIYTHIYIFNSYNTLHSKFFVFVPQGEMNTPMNIHKAQQ